MKSGVPLGVHLASIKWGEEVIPSKFQEQNYQGKQRASDFPLDHYLDFEKIKNKRKQMFEKEQAEQELEPQSFSRTDKLIKKINDLATEAEEKVKACIYNRAVRPLPLFSPVSVDESESGYTEHLVEAKFNEVTFQKPKGREWKLQQEIRKDQANQLRKSNIYKSKNNPVKYGRETYRSTGEAMCNSLVPPKQINRKKFNTKLDSPKHNLHYNPKHSSIIEPGNNHFREEFSESICPKTTCYYCPCSKGTGIGNHLRHSKDILKKDGFQHLGNNVLIDGNGEQINATYKGKHYNDASVNTDPLLVRPNTNLVNVVSSKEEKCTKMNDYSKKLCQIQELPLVVIRPNFTKQVGPIIDIKTTTCSPKNNVAVVECIHGGTTVGSKENTLVNVVHESLIDSASQTVSPPAVHFKNSRDLKLLKVTKDLLGKLNFKDGANVEKLKRSLSSLVTLLNQISPIHVADLRLSNLNADSASESIDTFFSNIDLVTEIIENEIKKPTGRYCDFPECLIKAVDLLCGNIRSVFVIEDVRKRTSKPSTVNKPGEEKKKIKKSSVPRVRKQLSKTTDLSPKPTSVTTNDPHDIEGNMVTNSKGNIPGNLYIPYRLLIPGGKHKAMEEAKNSRDIELRFKRLEKVLEINENLKKAVPTKESSQTDHSEHSIINKNRPVANEDVHVLNETFVIKSASDDDDDGESEIMEETIETKIYKGDQDYEDDWEDADSSKSYDGSLAMTDINVIAQVHSSGGQSSLVHSSPKKQFLSNQSHQELSVSSKDSRSGTLTSASGLPFRASKNTQKEKDTKDEKIQAQNIPRINKVHGEQKDVETQYFVGKRDIATMYCDDLSRSQKPKVEVLEPITIPSDAGSFTVLRMTNASTNSLLEVRFPEQSEKLQSSVTVQKTHNSEEVKLLYNLDKEDKIISQQSGNENGLKSVPHKKEVNNLESIQIDTSSNIKKALSEYEQNIDENSSLQKKENINDFQHITTNFIQFLENKVTEMVNKFKTSEVTCEKLLDQKLMSRTDHKASANDIHTSSSKASLKNELFYKSASSLISTQSNEDFGNWCYRRGTPDNQEIAPFENLTSPPLGLQLKDSNALVETSEKRNIDPKLSVEGIEKSNLIQDHDLDQFNDVAISANITGNINLASKEKEINKRPTVGGLHSRLLPLPENVDYNRSSSLNGDKEKVSSSLEIHGNIENSGHKETAIQQVSETASFKSKESGTVEEVNISRKNSALFEEAILALVSVEQSFENSESNEESTVIVAKTPTILSKSEDELDSQRTSVLHFASASESGIAPKHPFQHKILTSVPKDFSSSVPSESKINDEDKKIMNPADTISMEKDFSRLLPIPEQFEKAQHDVTFSNNKSMTVSNANVHSLFVSGPSHVDRGLKSSDSLFRKTDNSPVQVQENESSCDTPEVPSEAINGGSIQNLAFDNLSHSSDLTKSDTTIDSVSIIHLSQLLKEPKNDKTAWKKQFDDFSESSHPEEIIQSLPLNTEDISEMSDDCIKLNYFNPEEMSEGEIGYVYTSNSYSSGEIKPYNKQIEDDVLNEPCSISFQEIPHYFEPSTSFAGGEPNSMKNLSETKGIVKNSLPETFKSEMGVIHKDVMDSGPTKNEYNQENVSVGDILNSSNDSTSTGELKNLFKKEDKIDERQLIDIHVHCSTRFSSESSGCAESVESRESREEDI